MNYVELKTNYRKNLKIGLGISVIIHFFILLFFLFIKESDVQQEKQSYGSRMTYMDLGPGNSAASPSIVKNFRGGGGARGTGGIPVPVKNIKDQKEFSILNNVGDSTGKGSGGSGTGTGAGSGTINLFKKSDYLIAVEMQPEPIGGFEAIDRKVIYPQSARNNSIQGKVFLQVYINENGEVVFAEVLKGLGYGCDDAAIRAVKLVRFKAGKQNGRYVKVQMSIPVNIKLK
jgi:TonB family protein